MLPRIRRFFDVRSGEGLRVLLSFLYVAVVVAAFLLAQADPQQPVPRSSTAPTPLVYALRRGSARRCPCSCRSTRGLPHGWAPGSSLSARWCSSAPTSCCSGTGSALHPGGGPGAGLGRWLLPGVFYVWVNCFGVDRPGAGVDVRELAVRHPAGATPVRLVGAGASLGAITAGLLARFLVRPVGGTVNMLLVLAALILAAAGIVAVAGMRLRRRVRPDAAGRQRSIRLSDSIGQIAAQPLSAPARRARVSRRHHHAVDAFQLSLVANCRFGGDADALTAFFGTFNFAMGAVDVHVAAAAARAGAAAVRSGGDDPDPAARRWARAARSSCCSRRSGRSCSRTRATRVFDFRSTSRRTSCSICRCRRASAVRSRAPSTSSSAGSPTPSARCSSAAQPAGSSCCTGWARPSWDGRRQSGLDRRLVRRRLAAARSSTCERFSRAFIGTESMSERVSSELLDRSAARGVGTTLASDDPVRVKEALVRARIAATHRGRALGPGAARPPDADIRRRALAMLSADRGT